MIAPCRLRENFPAKHHTLACALSQSVFPCFNIDLPQKRNTVPKQKEQINHLYNNNKIN